MLAADGPGSLSEKYRAVIEENTKLLASQVSSLPIHPNTSEGFSSPASVSVQAPTQALSDGVSETPFSLGDSLLGGIGIWEDITTGRENDQSNARIISQSPRSRSHQLGKDGVEVQISTEAFSLAQMTNATPCSDKNPDKLELKPSIGISLGEGQGRTIAGGSMRTQPPLATFQEQAWEEVEKRLLPIENKVEAIREEMQRATSQVTEEVRALTARLSNTVTDLAFTKPIVKCEFVDAIPESTKFAEHGKHGTMSTTSVAGSAIDVQIAAGQSSAVESANQHFPVRHVPDPLAESSDLNKTTLRQGSGPLPAVHFTSSSRAPQPNASTPSRVQLLLPSTIGGDAASLSTQQKETQRGPDTDKQSDGVTRHVLRSSPDLGLDLGHKTATHAKKSEAIDLPSNVHELQRRLCQALQQLQKNEEEAQHLKRQIAQLQESLEQRDFEIASCPTHRYVQQLRNEISSLQRQLHPDREVLRKNTRTADLIRRDKRRQSFDRKRRAQGLSGITDIPKEDLERTVSNVCASLRVCRLEDAERTTQNLADIVEKHLPDLEKFAGKVFKLVQDGVAHQSPKDSVSKSKEKLTAGKVFAELCAWRDCHIKALREQTRLSSPSLPKP